MLLQLVEHNLNQDTTEKKKAGRGAQPKGEGNYNSRSDSSITMSLMLASLRAIKP